jgi:uncharacterized protein YicC (UPF0701 family)
MGGRQIMKNIQKLVETEFLRRSTPEEINDMFRQLKDKMDELEQENAKLKAKIHNIEEGLKRLEKHLDAGWYIIKDDGCCNLRFDPGRPHPIDLAEYAPTLSLLIDAILTGGE